MAYKGDGATFMVTIQESLQVEMLEVWLASFICAHH